MLFVKFVHTWLCDTATVTVQQTPLCYYPFIYSSIVETSRLQSVLLNLLHVCRFPQVKMNPAHLCREADHTQLHRHYFSASTRH